MNPSQLGTEHGIVFAEQTGVHIYATTARCAVHGKHIPATHINEVHHVWPKGMGGPDIPDNRIVVCATGHNSIHALLREFQAHKGDVPYSVLRTYSFDERKYAQLGYERSVRQAM